MRSKRLRLMLTVVIVVSSIAFNFPATTQSNGFTITPRVTTGTPPPDVSGHAESVPRAVASVAPDAV
jgi:hypothetical protein